MEQHVDMVPVAGCWRSRVAPARGKALGLKRRPDVCFPNTVCLASFSGSCRVLWLFSCTALPMEADSSDCAPFKQFSSVLRSSELAQPCVPRLRRARRGSSPSNLWFGSENGFSQRGVGSPLAIFSPSPWA